MITFTPEQKTTWRTHLAPKATDDQWNYFISECERRSLLPGTHVVFSTRTNKEYNKALGKDIEVQKVVMITTINALRLIAERGKKYEGRGPFTFYYGDGADGFKESKIPFGKTPHAVSVEMYRSDWKVPCFSVARFDAYAQKKEGKPTGMWRADQRGEEQCAKCCEAAGLRTVAPEECGDLYLAEEFGEEAPALVEHAAAPVAQPPAPIVAPVVNQQPAHIETTRFPQPLPAVDPLLKKALDEARPGETVTVGPPQADAKPAAPRPPAGPPRPPAPPAAPSPKPAQSTQPAPTTAPSAVDAKTAREQKRINADERPTRQPATEQPVQETRAELNEVADRIARDKDKPAAAAQPQAPVYTDDTPPAPVEFQAFMQRVSKLVRDKLPLGGMKTDAANTFKAYLLKQAGVETLPKIIKKDWARILSELEAMSAEDAAKRVREGHK